MLAVCAAGRILNPTSARSQVIGAMTMGVGAALMEELAVDKRRGFFVNHDLAGYEVPVHADIPHQDVVFLEETDPISSPMKAKGVGELGTVRRERGDRECHLQRHRRARARLPAHPGQADRSPAARRLSFSQPGRSHARRLLAALALRLSTRNRAGTLSAASSRTEITNLRLAHALDKGTTFNPTAAASPGPLPLERSRARGPRRRSCKPHRRWKPGCDNACACRQRLPGPAGSPS